MVNFSAVYCHNNKRKNTNKTFFSSPKFTSVARVLIAKLNREKDNLPSKKNLLLSLVPILFQYLFQYCDIVSEKHTGRTEPLLG